MKATARRYLRAAGSVLDIAPSTDYSRIVKKTVGSQSVSDDFFRIGGDFYRAIVVTNAAKAEK